ncbi:hypothetical protein K353_04342 [Kitasatospora sp. SolWspMP-SS2h]|uniref:hypothetical protein n=1 Tax=Kitasatospora sp. SolWspMP-SS2h TaxID=1305729 RepID=UPI000DB9C788|nr:hypothetical protein [Kitasatospora sp. SolWspMP-SS2h]RAJ38405.1 hypothetical protein K353_04342 [Kitasatospora sp. SolWspMP-SS2h]
MRAALWRVLLAPLTTLRALRLQRLSRFPFDFDSAWRQARIHCAPDEVEYLFQHGVQETRAHRPEP